ncbi:MAG: hypothetical protein AABY07_03565, partial [Nanoarchaeota archaeon]
EWYKLDYSKKVIEESREKNNGKIVLRGIFQKADVLNQNGRIYPKDILEREVRNYQKLIHENRALGECVPPGTEVMTANGWKTIENVSIENSIVTLNKNHEIELQKISKVIIKEHNSSILNIVFGNHGNKKKITVTPYHRVLLNRNCNNELISPTAKLIKYLSAKNNTFLNNFSMLCNVNAEQLSLNSGGGLDVSSTPYNGKVYCVSVPNKTWLMRQGSSIVWTHNCDHPDTSIVSLSRASHICRELYMDNDVVYGSIELLNTPNGKILQSLVDSGVSLGISSRGVGNTNKNEDGAGEIVDEGFMLVTFDAVNDPSTPNAFLAENRIINEKEINKVFTKTDKINRILNDILYFM